MVVSIDLVAAAVCVALSNLVMALLGHGWGKSVSRAYYGLLALFMVVVYRLATGGG